MLHLRTNDLPSVTLVPNAFIDEQLAHANGEFVKIYLYLLRRLSVSDDTISVNEVADALCCTEADVNRAISYWEKAGVLSMDSKNTNPIEVTAPNKAVSNEAPINTPETKVVPQKHSFSVDEIVNFKEKDGVDDLFFATQTYLGRPINQTEAETLLYWYEDLSMPVDLIEHLIESCLASGHASFHYMNAIAQNWYSDGIHTLMQAKTQAEIHSVAYYTVVNAMGITNRKLIKDEIDYVTKWSIDYAFSLDIIKEACTRTITQISSPSFKYADSILTDWHNAGVRSLKDIEPLDKAHKEAPKISKSDNTDSDKFGFTSRSDDYDSEIMKKLLLSSGE